MALLAKLRAGFKLLLVTVYAVGIVQIVSNCSCLVLWLIYEKKCSSHKTNCRRQHYNF